MPESVFVRNYGCTLNQAEALSATAFLDHMGVRMAQDQEQASCVVLFSCSVRNETEDRIVNDASSLVKRGKKVVVTSCLANSRPGRLLSDVPGAVLLIGGDNEELLQAVESPAGSVIYGRKKLPLFASGQKVYPVKIAEGCVSNCHFCITKLARPRLWSRPAQEIVTAVGEAVSKGAVEIDLTSMDNADYLDPPHTRLPELVTKVISQVHGVYKIRIGMMNPKGFVSLKRDLASVLASKNVYRFLHVPVQSGDKGVVLSMNRNYDPFQIASELAGLKQEVSDLRVATDIMVGYPTETEEAFENTLRLIRSIVFEKIHMFRFTPRPHTVASTMPQLSESVKKTRSEIAAQVIDEVANRVCQKYVGKSFEALVTSIVDNRLEARLNNYTKVYLKREPDLLGRIVTVEITGATPEHLIGRVVGDQAQPAY